MPGKEYEVRLAAADDAVQVLDVLYNQFDRDEPLMKFLLPNGPGIPEVSKTGKVSEEVEMKATVLAIDDGKIIGVAVNEILDYGQEDLMYADMENFDDKDVCYAIGKIRVFLDYIGKNVKISSHFPNCGKGILLDKLYVDQSHRGKGIAKRLIETTRVLGKQNNCNFMKVIASSRFTAKALERLGFSKIYSLDYKDYKVNGEVVFKIEPPHTAIAVYFIKI